MPATVEVSKEKWVGRTRELTLGATAAEGGTRVQSITVGGASCLPFLGFEGEMPHRPAVALEVVDIAPEDWSPTLKSVWGGVLGDPGAWAKQAVAAGADIIALTLRSTHPDYGNVSVAEAVEHVKAVLSAVGVPLIVRGPGVPERDNDVLTAVAEAAAGERLALANCEENNYRTIAAAAIPYGHVVIAKTPIEINLAKQLNILISDVGLDPNRILMDPTTGALGYGLEYTYSVMERLRLAALMGDGMTQMPVICTVGEETWRTKEAKIPGIVPDAWGNFAERGLDWEVVTATALLHSGADILVLRHPEALKVIKTAIDRLMMR